MIKSVEALAAHKLFYWTDFKPKDDLSPRPDEGLVLVEEALDLEAKAAGISTSGRSDALPVNSGARSSHQSRSPRGETRVGAHVFFSEQTAQVRERARFTAMSGDLRDEWKVPICYGREVRTKGGVSTR